MSQTEMMVYLGQQPNASLDLVTVFHLIEHFNIEQLIRLLDEIQRTLNPAACFFSKRRVPRTSSSARAISTLTQLITSQSTRRRSCFC